jgi:hypothetical protein
LTNFLREGLIRVILEELVVGIPSRGLLEVPYLQHTFDALYFETAFTNRVLEILAHHLPSPSKRPTISQILSDAT